MRFLPMLLALTLIACHPIEPVVPVVVDRCEEAGKAMALYCLATPGPKTMTWSEACRIATLPDKTGAVLAKLPVDCIAAATSRESVKACKVRCD